MATYLFRTPIRNPQGPRDLALPNPKTDFDQGERTNRLAQLTHRHGGYPVAVYIHNGGAGEKAAPTTADMQVWDTTYLGGRENVVSEAEAEMLTAAGYTVTGYDSPSYGLGTYGLGVYGR